MSEFINLSLTDVQHFNENCSSKSVVCVNDLPYYLIVLYFHMHRFG